MKLLSRAKPAPSATLGRCFAKARAGWLAGTSDAIALSAGRTLGKTNVAHQEAKAPRLRFAPEAADAFPLVSGCAPFYPRYSCLG
jgi:hypothetical protein